MLSAEEKQNLYKIIAFTIGDFPNLKEGIIYFNDQTVEVVEKK